MLKGKQWQVYAFNEDDGIISDDNPKVLAVCATQDEAEIKARAFEDDARAKSVLKIVNR